MTYKNKNVVETINVIEVASANPFCALCKNKISERYIFNPIEEIVISNRAFSKPRE